MTNEEAVTQELLEIEKANKNLQPVMEKFELIKRLTDSEDFKQFIEWYFTDEAKRLGDVLTSTSPLSKDVVEVLQEKQLAIRHFKLFMQSIEVDCSTAELDIENNNEYKSKLQDGSIRLVEESDYV